MLVQIVIDGVLTNYEVVNPKAKTPVIILHGWGQNSSHWLPLAKEISDQFRLYLLDLPGFGGTKNLPLNSDIPRYSEFVNQFAQKLGLKKFILSGHSFGGQIAGDFAIRYSKSLSKLILIDAAIIRKRSLKVNLKILVTKILKPLTLLLPKTTTDKILAIYSPSEYVKANDFQKSVLKKILKYDLSSKLHLIKVPTEIIWGSEDTVVSYFGKLLVETISNSNLHIIYPAGHNPHLTHTSKLATTLNKILA